ncbi:uroplakin-3b-like [Mantella aurantiaca]
MHLHVKLGLLLAICSSVSTIGVPDYIPKLTSHNVNIYNVSQNMFVLEQPNCTFTPYPTTNVWLIVAKSDAVPSITDANLANPVPYTSFINNLSNYYHTLPMSASQYPCSNSTINILLIGSEKCSGNPFCNGKLKNVTYRVKFVLLSSTGIFQQTQWSDDIVLLTRKGIPENTGPASRSGGMIALTSILCVLLAIMLICLLAACAIGRCQDICWQQSLNYDKDTYENFDYLTRGTYRSHYDHLYT